MFLNKVFIVIAIRLSGLRRDRAWFLNGSAGRGGSAFLGGRNFGANLVQLLAECGVGEGDAGLGQAEDAAGDDIAGVMHAGDDAIPTDFLAAGDELVLEFRHQVSEDGGVESSTGGVAAGIAVLPFFLVRDVGDMGVGIAGADSLEMFLGGGSE